MGQRGMNPQQYAEIRKAKGIKPTKLQKIRVKKGLSQSELSTLSGVSVRRIQSYEQKKNAIENARIETICNLCIALNCKIEDLLENKELIGKFRMTK